jgi:hypothetical protein
MIPNIAILTTVANFDLYKKSAPLFPQNIQKYVIDGTNGMHALESIKYMFKKLKNKNIEWLIMADEDVIFTDPNAVFEIIEYMKNNDYTVCGVRDGGAIPHRIQNPYLINTFFSILNFAELKKIWNEKGVTQNQYLKENEFEDDITALKYDYNVSSLYEPYYCFYLWLRRKGNRLLFLEASVPFNDDQITNEVKDCNGNTLLYHTWHARSYGVNEKHTFRIDKILNKFSLSKEGLNEPIVFKDKTFAFRMKLKKILAKILIKIKSF